MTHKGAWPLTLDYPPIWTAGFAAVIWLSGRWPGAGPGFLVLPGWLIVLAALGLMAWAAMYFRQMQTSINPHGQPAALITGGPFALSRNPIYLADALVLVGLALVCRALPALILIPVFAAIISHRFIQPEEARLTAAFPGSYPAYAARVRRWL